MTLVNNQGFSVTDLGQIQATFNQLLSAGLANKRICMEIKNLLAEQFNWKPYKFIIIEQINFEDDFAWNGIAASTIWKFNNKFYSFVWFL
jgi:hypothetical protein